MLMTGSGRHRQRQWPLAAATATRQIYELVLGILGVQTWLALMLAVQTWHAPVLAVLTWQTAKPSRASM